MLWLVLAVILVVVIPVVGFDVAYSHENRRCSADPEAECDMAGVAGIAAVLLIYAAEVVLALASLVLWSCWRLVRRRRADRPARRSLAGAGAPPR